MEKSGASLEIVEKEMTCEVDELNVSKKCRR
jgi:hypothetical protein